MRSFETTSAQSAHTTSHNIPEYEHLLRHQAFLGGSWVDADDGTSFGVTNPATGKLIGTVPNLGVAQIERAIAESRVAFFTWRKLLPQDRAKTIHRWGQLIVDNKMSLASLLTVEQGKPLTEAIGEIEYAAGFAFWFAEEAKRLYGEIIPSHLPSRKMLVKREPIGVVAAITPWNFPVAMLVRKAAAALAAGSTVVACPSRETPFSALALAALAEEAGLLKGTFSVLTGEPEVVVPELCTAKHIRAVSFTGSTEIGRLLLSLCASTVKRTCMELGGHAPLIIFEDADIDVSVEAAMAAKFQTSGQDCLAANRIFVHADLYDRFVRKFGAAVEKLKVGNGFEQGVQIGPLMNERAIGKCVEHIQDALAHGARLVAGGKRHHLGGNFMQPTVLADVTPDMKIFREETFGPVAAILRFDNETQVIESANDSEFGLAAYVYTNDSSRSWRLSDELEYGMVGVNTTQITGSPIPFGGIKQSGHGREGARQGIDEFTNLKYVCFFTGEESNQ
ncbi:MAG TPA: NAD-dependent succinate-semialdehyde dehydrogenase [Woeseiaceae bacterium]|nr:NAD-dependent succinate-semialdehyde dehydrogenase [Woeseiaceae bacterium]